MADESSTTDTAAPPETTSTEPATGEEALGDPGKKALDAMKAERNEATRRAKALERELEQVRLASLSEAEKAVELARVEARTATLREVGGRLVDAEVRAAAAGRLEQDRVEALLEGLDRSRFITDDGDVDRAALAAWVDKLAPAAGGPRRPSGDVGQGVRETSSPSTASQFASAIEGFLS